MKATRPGTDPTPAPTAREVVGGCGGSPSSTPCGYRRHELAGVRPPVISGTAQVIAKSVHASGAPGSGSESTSGHSAPGKRHEQGPDVVDQQAKARRGYRDPRSGSWGASARDEDDSGGEQPTQQGAGRVGHQIVDAELAVGARVDPEVRR